MSARALRRRPYPLTPRNRRAMLPQYPHGLACEWDRHFASAFRPLCGDHPDPRVKVKVGPTHRAERRPASARQDQQPEKVTPLPLALQRAPHAYQFIGVETPRAHVLPIALDPPRRVIGPTSGFGQDRREQDNDFVRGAVLFPKRLLRRLYVSSFDVHYSLS